MVKKQSAGKAELRNAKKQNREMWKSRNVERRNSGYDWEINCWQSDNVYPGELSSACDRPCWSLLARAVVDRMPRVVEGAVAGQFLSSHFLLLTALAFHTFWVAWQDGGEGALRREWEEGGKQGGRRQHWGFPWPTPSSSDWKLLQPPSTCTSGALLADLVCSDNFILRWDCRLKECVG